MEPGTWHVVLNTVAHQLFDAASSTGLVVLSPGPADTGTGLDLMAIAPTLQEARERLEIAEALLATPGYSITSAGAAYPSTPL